MCLDCYWYSLLSLSRNLLRKTIQLKIRYMVTRLYTIWNGHIKARIWCQFYERISFKNLKRELSCYSSQLFIGSEGLACWYVNQRSHKASIYEKNLRKGVSEQKNFEVTDKYYCKKWVLGYFLAETYHSFHKGWWRIKGQWS